MGKTAFVFSGRNGLDQVALRMNVLRIPEVSLRIREAQGILDAISANEGGVNHIDLYATIAAEDDVFLRNIRLKSLCATIVQVGLFDRTLKLPTRPDFIIGGRLDSPLAVISGRKTLQTLIEDSISAGGLGFSDRLVVVGPGETAPLLAGISLTEYEAVEVLADGKTGARVRSGFMDLKKLLVAVVEECDVRTVVTVGPGQILGGREFAEFSCTDDVDVVDSIELDPLLSWFWTAVRPEAKSLAN